MLILRDLTITLTAEELLAAQRQSGRQRTLAAIAEEAVALGRLLFAPAALYNEFEVHSVDGEQVALCTGEQGSTSHTPTLSYSNGDSNHYHRPSRLVCFHLQPTPIHLPQPLIHVA